MESLHIYRSQQIYSRALCENACGNSAQSVHGQQQISELITNICMTQNDNIMIIQGPQHCPAKDFCRKWSYSSCRPDLQSAKTD